MRQRLSDRANNQCQFVFWRITNQRVLLPGGQVQGCVVQAVHEVPQAGNVHLVLHGLGQTSHTSGACFSFKSNIVSCMKHILEENKPTAATGTKISTKSPAKACLMSLSLTSRKYWAHSCRKEKSEGCNKKNLSLLICSTCRRVKRVSQEINRLLCSVWSKIECNPKNACQS